VAHTITGLLAIQPEVLSAVTVNSSIVWGITPWGPFDLNRRFGVSVAFILRVEEQKEPERRQQ
jgi:hypothetical protein